MAFFFVSFMALYFLPLFFVCFLFQFVDVYLPLQRSVAVHLFPPGGQIYRSTGVAVGSTFRSVFTHCVVLLESADLLAPLCIRCHRAHSQQSIRSIFTVFFLFFSLVFFLSALLVLLSCGLIPVHERTASISCTLTKHIRDIV